MRQFQIPEVLNDLSSHPNAYTIPNIYEVEYSTAGLFHHKRRNTDDLIICVILISLMLETERRINKDRLYVLPPIINTSWCPLKTALILDYSSDSSLSSRFVAIIVQTCIQRAAR
jgi:hypothetical protein